VTGVKTDKGFSMLLVERQEGLETKSIKTSYSAAAGTTYVTYDDVKVPVENLLGKEHEGFQVILGNFNHERWMMCGAIIRQSRLVVEECLKWSNQRLVFGKRLIDQPVIRQKYEPVLPLVRELYRVLMCPWQTCEDDRTHRGQPGLAGEHHLPDDQDDL
jgi:alkylation response protein AidB-like acyl-CoA dehydrogenase